MLNHLNTHFRINHTHLLRFVVSYEGTHCAAERSHALLSEKRAALKHCTAVALTIDSSNSRDVDVRPLHGEQDALALSFLSYQASPSRTRTTPSLTSYASDTSYRKVGYASPRGYRQPYRIYVSGEPVHCTTLTPIMRAVTLKERENKYQNLAVSCLESGSSQKANNDSRSPHYLYGYRTPIEA